MKREGDGLVRRGIEDSEGVWRNVGEAKNRVSSEGFQLRSLHSDLICRVCLGYKSLLLLLLLRCPAVPTTFNYQPKSRALLGSTCAVHKHPQVITGGGVGVHNTHPSTCGFQSFLLLGPYHACKHTGKKKILKKKKEFRSVEPFLSSKLRTIQSWTEPKRDRS